MFKSQLETLSPGQILRFTLSENGRQLTFGETLNNWSGNREFRYFFAELLAENEFAAYRWETPCLRRSNTSQQFEFVLLNSPSFNSRATDPETFRPFYENDTTDSGVVVFENLGRDATLVVPTPCASVNAYGHLGAFVRDAPKDQVDELWRIVGETATALINDEPIWLSTAGGGVAWLHVRIDKRPKYYGYSPYRSD